MGKFSGINAHELFWEAHCKINLHLRIKKLRADGFHELEGIFLALDYGDRLHFELLPEKAVEPCILEVEDSSLPTDKPEDNIVYQAAKRFRELSGFDQALRISLEKRVPLGAGLGGGSADGAATLLALNELAGTGFSQAALLPLAAALGSDVPFFLSGNEAAWVSGRGEIIRPIPEPGPRKLHIVLVYPGLVSETAAAYRLLDKHRAGAGSSAELEACLSAEELTGALQGPPAGWPYKNDFLELFQDLSRKTSGEIFSSELGESGCGKEDRLKRRYYRSFPEDLKALGADFAGLTGSGSACFGVFSDGGTAEQAVKALSSLLYTVILTFPLAHLTKG